MTMGQFKTIIARLSAVILLINLMWGCGRVPQIKDIPPPSSRLPFVKVLLENTGTQHRISPYDKNELAVHCFKNGKRISYYSRQPIVVQLKGNQLDLYSGDGARLEKNIDHLIISPRGKNQIFAYDGNNYRGLLDVTSTGSKLKLINTVFIEDYLKGVVPHEIGKTPPEQMEAIKAQAVAARTYAINRLGQYGPAYGYDLKSDVSDQIYKGMAGEDDLVNKALEATNGLVATYDDKLINAYYHSTCGGQTDNIEDVWDKDPEPYLVSVSDGDACEISKYFTWTEKFTADQIIDRLQNYLSQEYTEDVRVGRLLDIRIIARTPGGRVASIVFETTSGLFTFNKEKVRWIIRRGENGESILRSANFDIDLRRDASGDIKEVIFNGRGYGHGVGMCQMGARALASRGIAFDSILKIYYQGIELKHLY